MTAIAFIAAASSLPPGWRIVAFPIAILMAAFFGLGIWMQVNTVRIVGPDSFGVKSPIDQFSWQVPVEEIERCQLIQASPHNKLRIIKKDGSAKSLPVTRVLWDSIMSITPTG